MHIHAPKPVESFKELAQEVGVIVIGILIALTGEQVVQGFEWNEKIKVAEEQMRHEITDDDGPQFVERIALNKCITDALDGVRDAVETNAPRDKVLAAIAQVATVGHTYDSNSYDSARASGVLSRLSSKGLSQWSDIFAITPATCALA